MIARTYFTETFYDMPVETATRFAQAIREAWLTGNDFEGEKKQGFFLSAKRSFEDKLYVGNIHRIENHLYWRDEELADDDQIVNVVVIDGPVTRDGDGCSYGSKDHRDQIFYANTIPQVVGHIFIINTPGGAASARIDYEQAIKDCREKGKPTVAWVDGMCASAGQLVASLCDRTIVMNGRNTMGCIGTMCAFWAVPHDTVDQDGYRYIELVSVTSPDKNAEYREAADGKTEKLQAELDRLGEEFRETVRQNRPLVKPEHLTGKTFDAQDVMGALVDEVGDYDRAIQAVFDLAEGSLKPAREVENVESNPSNQNTPSAPTEEPEEKTNTQTPNDMTQEEMKAAQEAVAETTEAPVNTEAPAEEAAPASEEENPVEEQHAEEEAPTEEPASEEATATEQPSEEAVAQAAEDIDKIIETLHTAEALVEQRDKEIAELKEQLSCYIGIAEERDKKVEDLHKAFANLDEKDKTIAALQGDMEGKNKSIEEKDALIEQLKKQNADLRAEVKELAAQPTPMTNADCGIPADNGTGEAPKDKNQPRVRRDMSYKEIREAMKKGKK